MTCASRNPSSLSFVHSGLSLSLNGARRPSAQSVLLVLARSARIFATEGAEDVICHINSLTCDAQERKQFREKESWFGDGDGGSNSGSNSKQNYCINP